MRIAWSEAQEIIQDSFTFFDTKITHFESIWEPKSTEMQETRH